MVHQLDNLVLNCFNYDADFLTSNSLGFPGRFSVTVENISLNYIRGVRDMKRKKKSSQPHTTLVIHKG